MWPIAVINVVFQGCDRQWQEMAQVLHIFFFSFIFLFCIKKKIDAEGGKGKTYNGAVDAAKKIYARSGLKRGLYAGLSAAYLRQWT